MKNGRKKITKHDIEIYNAVYQWYQESGPYPPSIRDISKLARSRSTNSVQYSLSKLRQIGLIEYFPDIARGVRLAGEEWSIPPKKEISVNMEIPC
jgi:SOS-response transcriptional repressor LexA